MFWRRTQKREYLPWYRRLDYKGDLTETEKRELDALRRQKKHPAARYEDLPDEVQHYIAGLELAAYDLKQDKAALKPIACALIGISLLYFHYVGPPSLSAFWTWAWALFLLIVPWFVYRREWNKNAQEFMPDYLATPGASSPANEALLREWEVSHLTRNRSVSRQE
jgi:hypothetical protein